MEPPIFRVFRVQLHGDLARLVDGLARENGESIESYIETVLREKTNFSGPKAELYRAQKPSRDGD